MAEPQIRIKNGEMLQDIATDVAKIDVLRRHSVGMKAWLVHRITGVGLLLYLLAHIGTMGTAMFLGDAAFERVFEILFHTRIFQIFDILVLAALLLHALNGIRLIVMDVGFLVRKQKLLFTIVMIVSAALFIWLLSK